MNLGVEFSPPIANVIKDLETLAEGLGEKGIRAGLVAAAKPLRDRMKVLAPRDTGALQKAVGHVSLSKRARVRLSVPQGSVAILVGANRKIATASGRRIWQGRKAHWHEAGTKHMRAKPFMSRAMAGTSSGLETRFYQGLSKYLERQRAKYTA